MLYPRTSRDFLPPGTLYLIGHMAYCGWRGRHGRFTFGRRIAATRLPLHVLPPRGRQKATQGEQPHERSAAVHSTVVLRDDPSTRDRHATPTARETWAWLAVCHDRRRPGACDRRRLRRRSEPHVVPSSALHP